MRNKSLFGITFTEETLASVMASVQKSREEKTHLRIATVNPEFLVAAEQDGQIKNNLRKADLRVVDGFGLWLVLFLQGFRGERITGAQLVKQFLPFAERNNYSVNIILKEGGLSSREAVEKALSNTYPNLCFSVAYDHGQGNPDFTLIATGIPDQEYQGENITNGVVMGVGGAIDFLVGTQKRAPKLFQQLGLEWLWRLARQPKRFQRIFTAVVVFPLMCMMQIVKGK